MFPAREFAMISEALRTAIGEVRNHFPAARAAADIPTFRQKEVAARDAADALQTALDEEHVPGVLFKDYMALRGANGEAQKAIEAPIADNQIEAVKPKLNDVETAIDEFLKVAGLYGTAWKQEPLLAPEVRNWVAVVAGVLFVVAATFAGCGEGWGNNGRVWPPGTTLAQWFGFGSFVLLAVWMLAYFAVRRAGAASGGSGVGSDMQYLVFGGMAFLVLGFLFKGVLEGDLIRYLSEIPSARGLITFLVAIGTIAIALILTLASVLMAADETAMLKERLARGKDILAVLVGVLGTIVGFYFANNTDGARRMTINVVDVSPREITPGPGGEFIVQAIASGGDMPYEAKPLLEPGDKGVTGEGTVNEQGLIRAKFTVGSEVKEGRLIVTVGASDKGGKAAREKVEVTVVKGKDEKGAK
jgi:hypothetical protein